MDDLNPLIASTVAFFDMRFVAVVTVVTGLIALWKFRAIIDGPDQAAIWGKVVPAAMGAGGAAMALFAFIRLLVPSSCQDLSPTELASLHAFSVLFGAVSGFSGLRRAFVTPAPEIAPPPDEGLQPALVAGHPGSQGEHRPQR